MINGVKTVLIACGAGIATSTIVCDAVETMCKENGIQAKIIQCKITEVPSYADQADLLITTTIVNTVYPFPVINARAFLTGIGRDKLNMQIMQELTK
jgi:PTS system galactitol-specific IIB component